MTRVKTHCYHFMGYSFQLAASCLLHVSYYTLLYYTEVTMHCLEIDRCMDDREEKQRVKKNERMKIREKEN